MEREWRSPADEEARHSVVRDMVREDRVDQPSRTVSTASADAVEAIRRAVRDLKHDVRMLKVGMDKQMNLLEELSRQVEDLRRERGRRA